MLVLVVADDEDDAVAEKIGGGEKVKVRVGTLVAIYDELGGACREAYVVDAVLVEG
jgi:hypothetical protein